MKNKAILLSAIIMGIFIFAGYDTDMKADPAPENTSISILNPQSYPTVGGNWTVFFNTTGKADLWITAVNGTEFNKDLTFFEVRCGDEILNYEWINNSILIRDYECSETGTETSKVLSAGKHHLEFRFGGDVEYAHNAVVFVRVGGDTDNSFSFDIGSPGTNRLVVVIADVEGAGTNLGGVTVDGKSCVLVARAENTVTGQNHQEMWYCDEDNLGASSGSVTVLLGAGSGATWGVHAHLYTGVSQSGPTDSGIDDTSTGTTVTVTGIDVPANGLVVMGAAEGTDALTVNSWTSPLIERQDGGTYDPDSADLASASGIETSAQTGKTYVATFSDDFNRGTGIVGVWPMANVVSWNQTTLNLGSGYKGAGRVNGSANITSVGTNTNVTVNCTSGNCSKITVSWSNSTNMTDGQSIQANFTCSDSAVGSFWANFSVKSVQDTTLAYINVSCTISSVVAWNQSTLNLTGYKGAGSVNGSANISSLGNNTNVTINCTAGSCSTISLISWSNSTNMTHNQNTRINFTCKDSTVGNFSANFSVKSVEDTTLAYINVSCNIAPGNVAWSQPNLSIGGPTTAGNATGYANIISNGNNTNVTVNCSTGNCTIILSNWTVANTTNQNYTVKFTCVQRHVR
jgi:hypothetical protein